MTPEVQRLERLAERLRSVDPFVAPPGAKIRGWNLVLAAVEQSTAARSRAHPVRRLVIGLVAAAVLLVAGALAASADSLPDSPIYPLKAVIESARGALTFSAADKLSYHLDLARTRLTEAEVPISSEDHTLLVDHARAGCIAMWCETRDRGYPFVFRRRLLKSSLPAAQLIYCGDLEDLSYLAGPIGRHLLRLGLPVVLAATNGPVPGVPGVYLDGKYPMYFRGQTAPRLGDLAYTEAGLFGF